MKNIHKARFRIQGTSNTFKVWLILWTTRVVYRVTCLNPLHIRYCPSFAEGAQNFNHIKIKYHLKISTLKCPLKLCKHAKMSNRNACKQYILVGLKFLFRLSMPKSCHFFDFMLMSPISFKSGSTDYRLNRYNRYRH